MMLVALAETQETRAPNPKQEYAYQQFCEGADTADIAKRYRMSEATVLRWISNERSAWIGRQSPYEAVS